MNNAKISYEALRLYSTPVVRVFANGRVLYTLSFTAKGRTINRPEWVPDHVVAGALKFWNEGA